jgi:hypothetical protein
MTADNPSEFAFGKPTSLYTREAENALSGSAALTHLSQQERQVP